MKVRSTAIVAALTIASTFAQAQQVNVRSLRGFDCKTLPQLLQKMIDESDAFGEDAHRGGPITMATDLPATITFGYLGATGKCGMAPDTGKLDQLESFHRTHVHGAALAFGLALLDTARGMPDRNAARACLDIAWREGTADDVQDVRLPLMVAFVVPSLCANPEPSKPAARKPAPAVKSAPQPDSAEAERLYREGLRHYQGAGVAKDEAKGARLHQQAAALGNAAAQFNLGWAYDEGRGVERNPALAAKWYRAAAEQGVAGAQVNLALCYERGLGVKQDDAEAVRWYEAAARQGDATAQANLGLMYGQGRGVPKDEARANALLRQAAAQGHEQAAALLKRLGVAQ